MDLVSQKTGLFGNLTLIQSGFLSRWREESIFIRGPKFLPLPQPLITANYLLIIPSAMPDLSEIFFQKTVPDTFPANIDPSTAKQRELSLWHWHAPITPTKLNNSLRFWQNRIKN
jgi:hypothetical protein